MRLRYENLPEIIRQLTKKSRFHKAVKKGKTLIVIHTTDNHRQVWKKKGKTWKEHIEGRHIS